MVFSPQTAGVFAQEVCSDLAAQIVRNGEGTGHVIRVAVRGADSDATARRVGKAVVNGPLFKSAIAGNDRVLDVNPGGFGFCWCYS